MVAETLNLDSSVIAGFPKADEQGTIHNNPDGKWSEEERSRILTWVAPGQLVSAATGADTAVARASIGVAVEPVGRVRLEWVLQGLIGGRLIARDLSDGVLRRATR
jgi:hypothetical protein